MTDPVAPVLGRPSPAAAKAAPLRAVADARGAAYRAEGGEWCGWSLRAATVSGIAHRTSGKGPEDAYGWRAVGPPEGELLVVAVADGVGSVEGAAAASQAAVEAACRAAVAPAGGGGPDWDAAFSAADAAVAASGGATTLVVAAVDRNGRAWLARVGDSTALLLTAGEWAPIWDDPDEQDEAVGTSTAALPSPSAAEQGGESRPAPEQAGATVPAGSALVLLTDGVADPLRDGPTTVAPALADALAEPPSPLGLTLLADFARQGCFDDRTILGLWAPAGERDEG